MDEENNQDRGNKDGKAVDTEGKTQMIFKENSRKTGTDDETQVEAQKGQRIGFFSLDGGGIVCVQRVVSR